MRKILLLAMFTIITSCSNTVEVDNTEDYAFGYPVSEFMYKGHVYIRVGYGITHAGHCKCNER